MMSNPPSVLEQRQRLLHRRQNSTPVLSQAMNVSNMPLAARPQTSSHRRGQSLDQPGSPTARGQYRQQPGSTVTGITNQGSPTLTGQQILREAQQQHLARPGQANHPPPSTPCGDLSHNTIDQHPFYDSSAMNAILQEQAGLPVASPLQQYFPQYDLCAPRSAGLESVTQVGQADSNHPFQFSHRVEESLGTSFTNERSMSQPDLNIYPQQRPITPAQHMNNTNFPLTPATTPFRPKHQQELRPRTDPCSPIKKSTERPSRLPSPARIPRALSLEAIFEDHGQESGIPSPTATAPLISSSSFEVAEMPAPQSLSLQALPMTFSDSDRSPASSEPAVSAAEQYFRSEHDHAPRTPLFGEIEGEGQLSTMDLLRFVSSQPGTSCPSPTKPELSPRRMSISDLHLEAGVTASIEETNVTLDDIAQFIDGPDPMDNKWICKYEDCNKKFGRKENIKSHVQTHLGDRQFRCDLCKKCFVRGHDLKRHSKIHTGSKPYPCLCGNSFARHDALTRHRQRGNCVGAFEGVVKKAAKKGRPRKHRPEMDDRLEKANMTRKRVEERGYHYASSASDSSASSFPSPPTETLETLSLCGGSPLDDVSLFGTVAQTIPENAHFPLDLFTFTPPASPGYSTGNRPSPVHREVTPMDLGQAPEMANIQTDLLTVITQDAQGHHGPPSLCHSSSSPVPDVLSFDFSTDNPTAANSELHLKEPTNNADFDSYLDYGNMGTDGDPNNFFSM